jgi:hypothetical protein
MKVYFLIDGPWYKGNIDGVYSSFELAKQAIDDDECDCETWIEEREIDIYGPKSKLRLWMRHIDQRTENVEWVLMMNEKAERVGNLWGPLVLEHD